MANGASNRPPLPPSIPYCWPFNYPKYVKDFDPNVHVKIFKAAIRTNNETFKQRPEAICQYHKVIKQYQLRNFKQFQKKLECIVQIITRQIIMLKLVKSKGRKTMFLQFMKLQLNILKYKGM